MLVVSFCQSLHSLSLSHSHSPAMPLIYSASHNTYTHKVELTNASCSIKIKWTHLGCCIYSTCGAYNIQFRCFICLCVCVCVSVCVSHACVIVLGNMLYTQTLEALVVCRMRWGRMIEWTITLAGTRVVQQTWMKKLRPPPQQPQQHKMYRSACATLSISFNRRSLRSFWQLDRNFQIIRRNRIHTSTV